LARTFQSYQTGGFWSSKTFTGTRFVNPFALRKNSKEQPAKIARVRRGELAEA
jgi:hypothetical protein